MSLLHNTSNNVAVLQMYKQWCSGEFSLVGTLAWYYGHIPYRYGGGGGRAE